MTNWQAHLSYNTPGKVHVCDPILLKHASKPTLVNHEIIHIDLGNPTNPQFTWHEDENPETVI